MKRYALDRKTLKVLEKRLNKELKKEYCNPDGFYCEVVELALNCSTGENTYTIDVSYGFKKVDGEYVRHYIDELPMHNTDGKIEVACVLGQIIQYIIDHDW